MCSFFMWQTEDFVDDLARAYMLEKIPVSLSYAQASVLLCIGLQGKDISHIEVLIFMATFDRNASI